MRTHDYWFGGKHIKTKFFATSQDSLRCIRINGNTLGQVFYFKYLGPTIQPNGQVRDQVRMDCVMKALLLLLEVLWSRNEISHHMRLRIYHMHANGRRYKPARTFWPLEPPLYDENQVV